MVQTTSLGFGISTDQGLLDTSTTRPPNCLSGHGIPSPKTPFSSSAIPAFHNTTEEQTKESVIFLGTRKRRKSDLHGAFSVSH
jgi:hypothetical protein